MNVIRNWLRVCYWVIGISLAVSSIGPLAAEEVSGVKLLTEQLAKVDAVYANCELVGRRVCVRKLRGDTLATVIPADVRFAQLDQLRRYRVTRKDDSGDVLEAAIYLATPEISFMAGKQGDEPFHIDYLSPSGARGRQVVLQNMLLLALASKGCNAYVYDPLSKLLAEGKLQLQDVQVDPQHLPAHLELKIVRLELSDLLNPPDPTNPNPITHQTGKLVVSPQNAWRVERLELKNVRQEGVEDDSQMTLTVSYDGLIDGVPRMSQVRWESSAYLIDLVVTELKLGQLEPADFTLTGSGIENFVLPDGITP